MTFVIERLGQHGDGVARGPSGPVYVPGTLPGETVEGRLEGDRLMGARIVVPSSDRVRPPCAHARACGGCTLQHARDGLVAEWKCAIIRQALAAHGLEAPIIDVVTSPAQSRRRATLSGRRTKAGVSVGFHMRGSDQVIEIPECRLLHPDLIATFPALEAITRAGASRKSALALTVTATLTGPDIAVFGGKPLEPALLSDLAAVAEQHGLARLTWDSEPVAHRTQPVVMLGRARVPLPSGAFLQATEHGSEALVEAVRSAVGTAHSVVDLFAGCGTFSLPLAETAEVHAVEGNAAMSGALESAWRGVSGLKALTVETRDLFRRPLLPEELRAEAVVLDPPRAGAEAQVAELATARVPTLVYVSCNPASFARDVRVLTSAGYRLDWIKVVDQFRWSSHVELAARLSLAHIGG